MHLTSVSAFGGWSFALGWTSLSRVIMRNCLIVNAWRSAVAGRAPLSTAATGFAEGQQACAPNALTTPNLPLTPPPVQPH
eukprot:6569853-Prymnesium_polylepis.1